MQNTKNLVGEDRSLWQYPIHTFLENGVRVCFGSDWPVTEVNPLHIIQVAVTHKPIEEPNAPAWLPGEMVSVQDAIQAYTMGSAYVNFLEKETGSLEVGKKADLIILDKNIFKIPPEEIHKAKVKLTMIDGKIAFES